MAHDRVDVIDSKGCSKLLVGASTSVSYLNSPWPSHLMPHNSLVTTVSSIRTATNGPFAGLVVCVTGLSKEARKQVMNATERLGGQYSSSLHPQCTHLVVQSFGGRKFEHAMKHGLKNGLYVVTLGWFIDSVRRNVRLSESLYSVRNVKENGLPWRELNQLAGYPTPKNSCLPAALFEEERPSNLTGKSSLHSSHKESRTDRGPLLANECFYIDSNVSVELKIKVVDALTTEGAKLLEHWFVGCHASHVVCEGSHIQRYVGHANNLVTPLWVLKTVKEKYIQRLVHLSSDLSRQVAMLLENTQGVNNQVNSEGTAHHVDPLTDRNGDDILENRQKTSELAKIGVRNRRRFRMQSFEGPLRPITPTSLLDSICWSLSDPTSSVEVYTDFAGSNDACEHRGSLLSDMHAENKKSKESFDNISRPLKESEKVEVILKCPFLTILFPIDRFGELGPSSRTFFSKSGFTCLQVLDLIYNFYQENLSADEVAVAIHTDSRHSDKLRTVYASRESINLGFVPLKRIEFIGSRKSFEVLKRVSGENNSNVYELVIRA